MRPLDSHTRRQMIDLLTPLMASEPERRAVLLLALFDHPLMNQLDFTGSVAEFLPRMIEKLYQFDKLDDGHPALWVLLEVIREQVGLDGKHRIDALRPAFDLPPPVQLDRVFVSYSRKNERDARRIVGDLKDAGLRVWYDREKIKGGEDWWQSILRGIANADYFIFCLSLDSIRSLVARNELLAARQYGKPIFAIMLQDCLSELNDEIFAEIQWLPKLHIINFTRPETYGVNLRELIQSLPGYTPPDLYYLEQIEPRDLPNPFLGLEAFLEVNAPYFAGREEVVQELLARTQNPDKPRLLAVVGASGSGKSSLVRAGLLPALRQKAPFWETVTIRPGSQPLDELADRLQERLGTDAEDTRKRLRDRETVLDDIAAELMAGKPDDARFIVFIDQFEELFTLTGDADRQALLDLLLSAINKRQGRVYVILTLRADFFDRLSALPALALLVRENLDIAMEMTPEQLRRSIEDSVRKVGVTYEDGLVEQILEDVRAQPGSLPLLQYALKELFERKLGRVMTHEAYERLGGVKGALATRADNLYAQLSAEEQEALRRVLLRLVKVSDESVTRRQVAQSDLVFTGIADTVVQEVLNRLTHKDARLLVVSAPVDDNNPANDDQIYYEVSHEALLTHWKRLAGWIAENRDHLRHSSEILELARQWNGTKRQDTSYLLSGGRLVTAREWLLRSDPSQLQRDFVEASLAREQQQRLQRRRGLMAFGGLTILLLLVSVVFLFEQNRAQDDRLRAQRTLLAQQAQAGTFEAQSGAVVAAQATNVADAHLTSEFNLANALRVESQFRADQSTRELAQFRQHTALQLAVESLANYPAVYTTQGHQALLNALTFPAQSVMSVAHNGSVQGWRVNQDHTRLLTWGADLTVRLWEIPSGRLLWVGQHGIAPEIIYNSVKGAIWNADESRVLSWGTDGIAKLWDAETGTLQLTLTHEVYLEEAFWNVDETIILTRSLNNSVGLWDAHTGAEIKIYQYENPTYQASWNADETRLFIIVDKNPIIRLEENIRQSQLRVYDMKTGSTLSTIDAQTMRWNPQHTLYYTKADEEGVVQIWDGQSLELVWTLPNEDTTTIQWSDDGALLLTLTDTYLAQAWDVRAQREAWSLEPASDTVEATFKAGQQLVTRDTESIVHIWETGTGKELESFRYGESILNAAWSPSEAYLLTRDGNHFKVYALGPQTYVLAEASLESLSEVRWFDDHHVIGRGDGVVQLWRIDPPAMRQTMTFETSLSNVMWNSSGTMLMIQSDEAQVQLWSSDGKTHLRDLIHRDTVLGAAWSANGSQVLTWSEDGSAVVWEAATGDIRLILEHDDMVSGAIWNHDESLLLTWSDDSTVRLWDTKTGDEQKQFLHDDWIIGATWNADETQILSWSEDYKARVWDVETGQLLVTLEHDDDVNGAAWSPDETKILTWSDDHTARVWDTKTGALRLTATHGSRIRVASWYPEGNRILVIPDGEGAAVWDLKTKGLAFHITPEFSVEGFLWSSKGERLLLWSAEGMGLWNAQTGEQVVNMTQTYNESGAAWNTVNNRILSWVGSRCILWDGETGAQILLLDIQATENIEGTAWTPDQTRIALWTRETVTLWTVDIDQLLALGRISASQLKTMNNTERGFFVLPTLIPSVTPTY